MNETIKVLKNHKTIRKYKNKDVSRKKIETIVRAGQQAPFVSQLYSLLYTKKGKIPFEANIYFIICVDFYKMKKIMEERNWEPVTNDLSILIFGIQDAAYMAQNMVVAAESMNLGTCFLGGVPYQAAKIKEQFDLPDKVFPLVGLVMGYPDENPPVRPRYQIEFTLFHDKYSISNKTIKEAKNIMDKGYLEENYYEKLDAKIPLKNKEETFDYDNYSWTEHISRKWGQWYSNKDSILKNLKECGFDI